MGTIPYVEYNTSSGYLEYAWYNVTADTMIGTKGGAVSATWASGNIVRNPYAEAVIAPSVTTIVELRLIATGGTVSQIGFTGSGLYPSGFIEVISDGTKIAQFQGATDSSDGQAGYVPAPLAGQEGSLLIGDGNWSDGLTFLNTTADRGLRIESIDNAFLILRADTDNDGSEIGAPYIGFQQDGDGGTPVSVLGMIQAADTDPAGNAVTGALENAFYLGAGNRSLQFGTGLTVRITISTTGDITIGQSDTTGSLLRLDTKTNSGDPTGVNGGMYYNSNLGKFRCYENGAWVNCISAPPSRVVFTSSGTFTKASYPGLKGIRVQCQGGGGGSAGAAATGAGQSSAGGGGGGGGYAEVYVPASSLASSVTVTVGAGGSGGAAGANDGTAGGTTSFGSHCSATGGSPGEAEPASSGNSIPASGNGGVGTAGDILLRGGDGQDPVISGGNRGALGNGGTSYFAPGMRGANASDAGADGVVGYNYGGGAAGAHNGPSQATARAGADGAPGIVVVTLYF